ncbi:MAG: hypothetical protein MJB14_17100 [Spirochaetes bacterium]|nr:hypothetical protein [Spirochaetota bacterium]
MSEKLNKDDFFWIEYIFDLKNRDSLSFTVLLDKNNITAIPPENSQDCEWTRLGFHQCEICPLETENVANCPIAYNISGLAEKFNEIYSTETAKITVNVEERTYLKNDSVQQGLRSILGIYLATSGCPHMQILKPMARFHLPFASMEETIYRHVGNYLISQYYQFLEGKKPDINLDELIILNENVDKVNHGICRRIEKINEADANKNALIILNAIGMMLDMELKSKLDSLKYLFP